MASRTFISLLAASVLYLQVATASVIVERQRPSPSPTSTYTYTKDTLIQPTPFARFITYQKIPIVWYIPDTPQLSNAETFNVTIALNGKVAGELSSFCKSFERNRLSVERARWLTCL